MGSKIISDAESCHPLVVIERALLIVKNKVLDDIIRVNAVKNFIGLCQTVTF